MSGLSKLKLQMRVGWRYFLLALKARMEYRADFFLEVFAALLQQVAGLAVLMMLFQNFSALGKWSREEVFFIYGFSLIPAGLFDIFSMSLYMFSDKYIVQGELDRL